MALLVSSLPLSLTIIFGLPRLTMRRSSSRATRKPESEVSATSARHSRVQSSTIARIRKRRPSVSWSETKSRLQRSLGANGVIISALWCRSPVCARRDGGPLASPHGRAGRAFYGSPHSPPASEEYERADRATAGVHGQSPSSAPEDRDRRGAWTRIEPSCGSSRWLYTPAARSARSLPSYARQLSARQRASPLLSQEILQSHIIEHGVG